MMHNIFDLIHSIKVRLEKTTETVQIAEIEAWWLLQEVTCKNKVFLITQKNINLSSEQEQKLENWLNERIFEKKPLQYILGSVPFCSITILVHPPILIPRPETEELVSWMIEQLSAAKQKRFDILDLCTGTGCIALALGAAFPQAHIVGVDINPDAIALAEKNKALNKIANVSFQESNLYKKLDTNKKFDLIISNPPYLSEASYAQISEEIKQWEDKRALVGDNKGMFFYEKIIQEAPLFLKQHTPAYAEKIPQLVLEIGIDQNNIEEIFLKNKFSHTRTYNDLQGRKRWISSHI